MTDKELFESWWNNDKDIPEILMRAGSRVSAVTNMAERCSLLSEFWSEESFLAACEIKNKELKELEEKLSVAREALEEIGGCDPFAGCVSGEKCSCDYKTAQEALEKIGNYQKAENDT